MGPCEVLAWVVGGFAIGYALAYGGGEIVADAVGTLWWHVRNLLSGGRLKREEDEFWRNHSLLDYPFCDLPTLPPPFEARLRPEEAHGIMD